MTQAIMTVDQAAEYLQVAPTTLYRWLNDGRIPGVKLSRNVWRIPKDVLDEWLAKRARLRKPYTKEEARQALEKLDSLRKRIRERRGEPFPAGTSLQLLREGRKQREFD